MVKRNFKTLVIIFSIVLNIIFVGTYFYHKMYPHNLYDTQFENRKRLIYEELNLSQEQLDTFKPRRKQFHTFLSQQKEVIRKKQLQLINILAGDKQDRKAIDNVQNEIRALQHQMQAKVVDHLLEESEIFNTEQRKKFFILIKERIEKNDASIPKWMLKSLTLLTERAHP